MNPTNGISPAGSITVRQVTGKLSARLNMAFYATVLLTALAGASQAATGWLDWPLPVTVPIVAAVELGAVALSVHADERRRIGERAYASRILSATVAALAVAVNWFGHVTAHMGQAAFFAAMSALGYLVWLIHSGARRRDQLRAAGKLEDTAPAYGIGQWLRHPGLTRRARALALAGNLGKLDSLAAAREQIRRESRLAAISTSLRQRITATVDPTMADIAVNTYDLDTIAGRLADRADYDGLTALLAADLTADRIAGQPTEPDHEPAEEDTIPVSGAAPVDLAQVSKTAAIHYAHTALGQVPAGQIVTWLADQGVEVSASLVYKARRQVSDATQELPDYIEPAAPVAQVAQEPAAQVAQEPAAQVAQEPASAGRINGRRPALAATPAI